MRLRAIVRPGCADGPVKNKHLTGISFMVTHNSHLVYTFPRIFQNLDFDLAWQLLVVRKNPTNSPWAHISTNFTRRQKVKMEEVAVNGRVTRKKS